jgi:hypothetical protein
MKVLNMTVLDWLTFFMGSGLIGKFIFNIKGAQAWAIFLLAWILVVVAVHKLLGVQTQVGYYIGLSKNPKYPGI